MKNFWENLKKPIFILAPMYDVTDIAFREVITQCAKPDIFFTEFVNCDGLVSDKGSIHFKKMLEFTPNQHPIVAQIWGNDPNSHYQAAQIIQSLGFDGIDINMGCPRNNELKIGACAALIDNQTLAAEIIKATKEGANNIPVSVKTRIGLKKKVTEPWLKFLLEQELAAITIHGRLAKDMSDVPANWNEIEKGVKLRNSSRSDTLIIGNGDVQDYAHGLELIDKHGVDGVMIGRGIFKNIWAFENPALTHSEKDNYRMLLKHLEYYEQYKPMGYYGVLKKFYKIYIKDTDNAKDLRRILMETENIQEAKLIIKGLL